MMTLEEIKDSLNLKIKDKKAVIVDREKPKEENDVAKFLRIKQEREQ